MQANQPSQDLPNKVKVTLLLEGGQDYVLSLATDSPLLQQLYEVLVDWDDKRAKRLFQIPVNKGRSVVAFPCHRLVGVVTEPPLVIQQQATTQEIPMMDAPIASGAAGTMPPQSAEAIASGISDILLSESIQIEGFLSDADHQRLVDYAIAQEANFQATTTFTGESNYRESSVLYHFPEFAELIAEKIRAALPTVIEQLRLTPFELQQIESQLTAHNDGNYYKIHNDNGSPDTANRELTYVYYFYREPKAFTGGELRIYDSQIENNYYVQADSFHMVEPNNNSIVLFLSRYMHEVLPIQCPSRSFADSRFTINGWLRR